MYILCIYVYTYIICICIFFVNQDHNSFFTGLLQYDCETFWYRLGT